MNGKLRELDPNRIVLVLATIILSFVAGYLVGAF